MGQLVFINNINSAPVESEKEHIEYHDSLIERYFHKHINTETLKVSSEPFYY